jgi:superfamily II DNA or RNA helicase
VKLRPYQIDAINAIRVKFQSGITRQLLVLPTGTGKTCVFAAVPSALGITKRVLILVHREELANQAADKYKRWNPDARVAVEMAERRANDPDTVVVASVQTLRKGGKRLLALNPTDFGAIITDEAHHATADSYMSIYEHFGVLSNENKILLLGVTATPNRADGEGLSRVFQEIVYSMGILDAIKAGWLSNLVGYRVSTGQSLDNVHTRCGDFATDELASAVNNAQRNSLVVKHWKEKAQNLQTLVFCVDIAHAKAMAETFRTYGVAAEAVWGDDERRAEKLDALRSGAIRVICNCAILTEGYDDWHIGCIVMARPTKSQLLFVQCCGRGTRIPDGVNNLCEEKQAGRAIAKENCILLDVVDATSKHSLVTLPSLFGLGERMDMKGKTITAALKKVEEVQEQHPNADLEQAPDLDKLESYAESVDLFSMKWASEVLEGSTLQWHKVTGRYTLNTKTRKIDVFEDLLQMWNVHVKMGELEATKGGLPDLTSAFRYAEEYVKQRCSEEITLIRREAAWHKDEVTPGQIKLLRKFHIPIPAGLTKGEASIAIGKILNRRPAYAR